MFGCKIEKRVDKQRSHPQNFGNNNLLEHISLTKTKYLIIK